MYCCINCFQNRYIVEWIQEYGEIGDCNYCGSESIEVVGVDELGDFIRECLSKAYINATTDDIPFHVYEENENVYSIDDILRWEENIFSEELEDLGKAEELLSDLMSKSGPSWREIAKGAVDPFEGGNALLVLKNCFYAHDNNRFQYNWDEFTYIVKHVNRFFDVASNRTREELLSEFDPFFKLMTKELPIGYRIWRGRLDPNLTVLNIDNVIKECGPPPRRIAKPNRMNPAGISYFYGAEDLQTSKEEIRAAKGTVAIYGLFETKKKLRIVDLSEIPHVSILSIFSPDYDHDMRWAKYFLMAFQREISKPVKDDEKHIEYLPTQILTEYIRAKGYDGLRYRSSLTDGFNVTLFCGPQKDEQEDDWIVKKLQIPVFTDWLRLVDYRIEKY